LRAIRGRGWLVSLLDRLNGAFNDIPSAIVSGPALPPLMMSQAQSAFLAAVRMSLGGQVHAAFMLLRGCIECSLYSLIMSMDPSSQAVWVDREKNRAECRKLFNANVGLAVLENIDKPLSQFLREAYELIAGGYAFLYSQQGWTSQMTTWWHNGYTAASTGQLPRQPITP
jgi:hypothetical protein